MHLLTIYKATNKLIFDSSSSSPQEEETVNHRCMKTLRGNYGE